MDLKDLRIINELDWAPFIPHGGSPFFNKIKSNIGALAKLLIMNIFVIEFEKCPFKNKLN